MIYYPNTRLNLADHKKFVYLSKLFPAKFAILNKPQADLAYSMGVTVPHKRIFYMSSGNGAGKTAFLINVIANLVWKNINIYRKVIDMDTMEVYPGFFDYPLFNSWPKTWPKKIWYVSNSVALDDIYTEFSTWIPPAFYIPKKMGYTYYAQIDFRLSDWILFFKTIDQDPKVYETANVGVIIFDEPPPYEIYRRCIRRLRKGGIIIIGATPLFGSAFLSDEIKDKATQESDKFYQQVSIFENCIESAGFWDLGRFGVHPKGNLFYRDVKIIIDNLDIDEKQASIFGVHQHLIGKVYKTYRQDVHFTPAPKVREPKDYSYQFILDPHDRKPAAAMWIRINRWNRKAVIREWPSVEDSCYQGRMFHEIKSADPYDISDFVRFFVEIFKELKIPAHKVQGIIDPNFGVSPIRRTGRLVYEEYQIEFRKQGYPIAFIIDVHDGLAIGHKAVKGFLKVGTSGFPGLMIDSRCKNTDWSFRHYSYDDWEGKTADKRGLKEDVKEIGKDYCDLVRYACMTPINYVFPEKKKLPAETDYGEGNIEERFDVDEIPGLIRPVGSKFN